MGAFAILSLLAPIAVAQVNTASLTGLVKDPSEAVISGAKITARHTATGSERAVQTDGTGYYFLANLPIGAYTISVEKAGFQKAVATINLDGDRLALAVGQQSDHDLFFALLVVAIISPSRQGIVVALQIAAQSRLDGFESMGPRRSGRVPYGRV